MGSIPWIPFLEGVQGTPGTQVPEEVLPRHDLAHHDRARRELGVIRAYKIIHVFLRARHDKQRKSTCEVHPVERLKRRTRNDVVWIGYTDEMVDQDRPSGLLPVRTEGGLAICALVVLDDERRQRGVLG